MHNRKKQWKHGSTDKPALVLVSGRGGMARLSRLSMQSLVAHGCSGEVALREGSSRRISQIFLATILGPADVSIPWFNLKRSHSGQLPGRVKHCQDTNSDAKVNADLTPMLTAQRELKEALWDWSCCHCQAQLFVCIMWDPGHSLFVHRELLLNLWKCQVVLSLSSTLKLNLWE